MARDKIVRIVNRTTEPLEVMWDGVIDVIPPGYKRVPKMDPKNPEQQLLDKQKEPLFEIVGAGEHGNPYEHPLNYFIAEAAKRQNPKMGSMDATTIDPFDTEYLLGVREWGDEVGPTSQTDAIERLDRSTLPADRQNIETKFVPGARRVLPGDTASKRKQKKQEQAKRRKMYSDTALKNPNGIRADHW